jgi:hypothetical protein
MSFRYVASVFATAETRESAIFKMWTLYFQNLNLVACASCMAGGGSKGQPEMHHTTNNNKPSTFPPRNETYTTRCEA